MNHTPLIAVAAVVLALAIGGYLTLRARTPDIESRGGQRVASLGDGQSADSTLPRSAPLGSGGGVADGLWPRRPGSRQADTTAGGGASGPRGARSGAPLALGARRDAATGSDAAAAAGGSGGGSGAAGRRAGLEPVPMNERAAHLPDAARHGQTQTEAGADEAEVEKKAEGNGADPDVLLSVPLKASVAPEVGEPPIHSDGVVVKDGEVELGDTSMITFPAGGNVNGEAGTVAFEITPTWAGSDQASQSFVQILEGQHTWENRMALVKNVDALRFMMIDSTGVEHNVGIPITDWMPDEPHQVAATWGDALMSLYVDGVLVGQATYQGEFKVAPNGPIYVGYNDPASTYNGVGGRLRDLKIYGRALGANELGQ